MEPNYTILNRKDQTAYQFSSSEDYYQRAQTYVDPSDLNREDSDDEYTYRDNQYIDETIDGPEISQSHTENKVILFLNSIAKWIQENYKYWISGAPVDYRDNRAKRAIKNTWIEHREPLFIFLISIVFIIYAYYYFEIGKQLIMVRIFVDSQKRVIVNPILNPEYETVVFFDISDILEMEEWAKTQKENPKLNKSVLESGFIEMNVYGHETRRNVSIELLIKAMETHAEDKSCISALNFGIIKNVILIRRVNEGRVMKFTMYDPFIETTSTSKVTASILKKMENADGTEIEVVVKKFQVPKKIGVRFYDGEYKSLWLELSGEESACVYQFIELYETLSNQIE